jgi:hypothetical protein
MGGLLPIGAQSRAAGVWTMKTRPSQADMFYAATRAQSEKDQTALELLYGANPINDLELARAIERRPSLWARYAGYVGQRASDPAQSTGAPSHAI